MSTTPKSHRTTHTPGPWTLTPCSHGGLILRRGEAIGRDMHMQSSLQILPEEDAHLIAAAPDLLAEVKALLDFIHARNRQTWTHEDTVRVEAAIAKAEGK